MTTKESGLRGSIRNVGVGVSAIPDTIPQTPFPQTLVELYSDNIEPHPEVSNPVLTKGDVTDATADFVADPFIFIEDGNWYMFFETYLSNDDYGVISYATSQDRGVTWDYQEIVLDTGYLLALPQVFKVGDTYYMSVHDKQDQIELFSADSFPTSWSSEAIIKDGSANGNNWDDPVYFRYDGRWWCIAAVDADTLTYQMDAFYSDNLTDNDWTAHPDNPIVDGRSEGYRPGGRPYVFDDGRIFIPYMDAQEDFSRAIRIYEITDLTPTTYTDTEVSNGTLLDGDGTGWNAEKMHTYDPWWQDDEGRWVSVVDGNDGSEWSIGIYHTPTVSDYTVTEV